MDFYLDLLSFLAGVTVRSLVLVAVAGTAILTFRITAAAARHAVLTIAAGGMLMLAALSPVMPPVAIRVLRAPAAATVLSGAEAAVPTRSIAPLLPQFPLPTPTPEPQPAWPKIAVALYTVVAVFFLVRLGFGYLFTVRLVRASRPVSGDWPGDVCESSWISVPLTVGWLRPKILLPSGWDQWSRAKLEAVMAHERTHIARGDWAISVLSGVNRCLFWFNPAAWWLERSLASLAEEACDDAALLLVESGHYAQALLEMAAAVKTGQGRLVWEAMAMAKAAEVRKRIDRILDETRQIPRALTRSRWIALAAVSLPLIYVTSVVRLAAQEPKTPAAMAEFLKGKRQFSAADAATMEQYLTTNPSDVDVRSQLVVYYFMSGSSRQQRFDHIQWVVANAPESEAAGFVSQGVSPIPNSLNDPGEHARIAALWRQQTAAHPKNAKVLGNAGQFFAQAGGDFAEAERLFQAGKAIDSTTAWINRLADLYARAVLGATGDAAFARADSTFATRVRKQLEESEDMLLVTFTGSKLAGVARRPAATAPLKPGEMNLDDHPLLLDAVDFGKRLMTRARPGDTIAAALALDRTMPNAVMRIGPGAQPIAGLIASPAEAASPRSPDPISKVDPVYPPLARQARIQGVVRLAVRLDVNGGVESASVVNGHPLLQTSSLDAVKQWRFPAGRAGTYSIAIPFALPPEASPLGVSGGVVDGVIGSIPGGAPPGAIGGIAGGVSGGVPGGVAHAPSKMAARIKVGGNVQTARILERVDPVYPQAAREAKIGGDVTLEVLIGPDGRVLNVKPLSGHPLLAGAARDAVQQWVYHPTKLNEAPVEVITTVTVPFELDK